jgi:hypothetical protein
MKLCKTVITLKAKAMVIKFWSSMIPTWWLMMAVWTFEMEAMLVPLLKMCIKVLHFINTQLLLLSVFGKMINKMSWSMHIFSFCFNDLMNCCGQQLKLGGVWENLRVGLCTSFVWYTFFSLQHSYVTNFVDMFTRKKNPAFSRSDVIFS